MTPSKPMQSLRRLVDLREREVDRLAADMAAKTRVRERYRSNLDRLDQLCRSAGASGAAAQLAPALSLNCGIYKQSVMQLAEEHRQDLALHEADMAVAQGVLAEAARRHAVLGQVLERQQNELRQAQVAFEQKRQDELATQVWFRERR